MMNNIYYVYIHERLDNNAPFYVGKGHADRAFSKHNRNKYWHHIVNKVGYRVKIVQQYMTETQALNAEKFTIAALRKVYSLCNMTHGGENGKSIRTKEHCENISKAKKGKPNPNVAGEKHGMWGKTHTEETKNKMRKEGAENGMYGKPRPDLAAYNKKGIGKKWFNNGVDNKQYFPGTEPHGWKLGRGFVRKNKE